MGEKRRGCRSYLQVGTVFTGKNKVDRVYHTDSGAECERAISRVALGKSCMFVIMIMWNVWPMTMPKVHHFGPVLRRKVLPDGDLTAMDQNFLAVYTADLGSGSQSMGTPRQYILFFLIDTGTCIPPQLHAKAESGGRICWNSQSYTIVISLHMDGKLNGSRFSLVIETHMAAIVGERGACVLVGRRW